MLLCTAGAVPNYGTYLQPPPKKQRRTHASLIRAWPRGRLRAIPIGGAVRTNSSKAHPPPTHSRHFDITAQRQCPPRRGTLEGPHMDASNITKLRHMKACLENAPSIQYVWLDMLCVSLAEPKQHRAARRTIPFFVQK